MAASTPRAAAAQCAERRPVPAARIRTCRGQSAVDDRRRLIGYELPVAVLARPDGEIPVVDVLELAAGGNACPHPAGDQRRAAVDHDAIGRVGNLVIIEE